MARIRTHTGKATITFSDGEEMDFDCGEIVINKPRTLGPTERVFSAQAVPIEFGSLEWNIENFRRSIQPIGCPWCRVGKIAPHGYAFDGRPEYLCVGGCGGTHTSGRGYGWDGREWLPDDLCYGVFMRRWERRRAVRKRGAARRRRRGWR